MAETPRLDASKLLGFDRNADPLWTVVTSSPAAGLSGKPAGIDKPLGTIKG